MAYFVLDVLRPLDLVPLTDFTYKYHPLIIALPEWRNQMTQGVFWYTQLAEKITTRGVYQI